MSCAIAVDADEIARFCQRNHIARLAFFGSVLTDTFTPESDVDVLVAFQPGNTPGFFALADMAFELEGLLGRKVDLRTAEDLSPYFRDEVVQNAELLYAE
ncbi:MAG: nucleotidyltransferase family protein [Candidatus Hydrogenedentes bacterium]|nr:nucleotidyltransferase family protein [Candidatus Hydrogenedentota bacterium]